EPEVRLEALAIEVQPDQRPADLEGEPSADESIEQPDPDQIPRNIDLAQTAQRYRDPAGDLPQQPCKEYQRDAGAEKAGRADRQLDRQPGIALKVVGDPLVGIVGLAASDLQAVVGPLRQPRVEVAARQPAAPAQLQHLLQVKLIHIGHDEGGQQECELLDLPL